MSKLTKGKIIAALDQLDPKDDEQWTSTGQPRVEAVATILGQPVTRQELTNAHPDFNRSQLIDNGEDDNAASKPPADAEQEKPGRVSEAHGAKSEGGTNPQTVVGEGDKGPVDVTGKPISDHSGVNSNGDEASDPTKDAEGNPIGDGLDNEGAGDANTQSANAHDTQLLYDRKQMTPTNAGGPRTANDDDNGELGDDRDDEDLLNRAARGEEGPSEREIARADKAIEKANEQLSDALADLDKANQLVAEAQNNVSAAQTARNRLTTVHHDTSAIEIQGYLASQQRLRQERADRLRQHREDTNQAAGRKR